LAPGCYVVGFVNPGGHIFTIPFLGGNTATDSNANQTTGRTPNINLVSGFDPTIDAGLVPGIDLCPPPGTTLPGDGKAGKLYIWQDADHVYARLDQSRNLNDNSYGTNIVQWTRSHTFSNLVGSDKAQFIFKNTTGNVVLDFYMDYITAKSGTPSGYASLGVTGGEGKINIGLAAWVVDSNTSIAQNLNDLGFCVGGNCSGFGTNLLLNSPPTVSSNSYDLPPGSPYTGWEFTNSYYVKVSKAAFGGSALGSLSIGEIHNSPPKTGDNAITPVPCIPGGECNIVEGTHEIKDRNLKWLLTNNGDVAAILTKLTLTWPEANGMLKKVKFDGDVVWDDGAPWTLAGITLDTANFTTDPKKKRIDPGKTRVFTLEFEKNAAFFPYQLKLIFDSGCEVDLEILTGPPTELAACSELKPIEQMVLQYSGVKTISSVSWFRTTVSDINNPGTANLIGTASGADIGITPYSFGNFAAASSTNDVDFVLTFTDDTKQRSRFHLSCSDPEMNDITDCGKLQGNAKDNSVTGGNLWTLRDLQGKGLQMCNYP
jgi:hypothetical protein